MTMRRDCNQQVRLLADPFNRAVLKWLSVEPRSFADIVAAFGLAPDYIRPRLKCLLTAGLLRSMRAEPVDFAAEFWTARTVFRAAERLYTKRFRARQLEYNEKIRRSPARSQ